MVSKALIPVSTSLNIEGLDCQALLFLTSVGILLNSYQPCKQVGK